MHNIKFYDIKFWIRVNNVLVWEHKSFLKVCDVDTCGNITI